MNFTKLALYTGANGFKNVIVKPFSYTIAGQTLGAGAFVSQTGSTPLNNAGAITQLQAQYSGLESFWRVINGQAVGNYSAGAYQVQTFYFFTNSTLTVETIVVNQTGGGVTIPTITVNCEAFLFVAPF